jgi:hypothetical protein
MRVVDLAGDGASRGVTFPIAPKLDYGMVWGSVVPDAGGRRIVTRDAGLHLRDGATGALVATVAEDAHSHSVLFLADGRIAVTGAGSTREPGPPRTLLRVFDPAGAPLGELRLDLPPGGVRVGPEVAAGRVAISSFPGTLAAADTLIVDVGEGRVVERLSGLWPAVGFLADVSSVVPAGAGVPTAHLFRDTEGRLIRIDFATGERRVVAGPGAPAGERLTPC